MMISRKVDFRKDTQKLLYYSKKKNSNKIAEKKEKKVTKQKRI